MIVLLMMLMMMMMMIRPPGHFMDIWSPMRLRQWGLEEKCLTIATEYTGALCNENDICFKLKVSSYI